MWSNGGFPASSAVKIPPANAGDTDLIPGSGRFLGEGNGTHSSILAWKIPWIEEPGGIQSTVSQRAGHNLATKQQKFDQTLAQCV